ncbi:MAG TPA: hypothetical protein IAB27_05350 [Candidatus Coprosoma intestinipullorum]|uniref:Uncharacterized protein n=1 Tax=Candidatus Coprosoma intestinipullorum TaxID=2840752 RepID=A0A9D0ZRK0_9FIRM|nr:hypothetical protein [Candidatus Coprosoma intestinipullorum]
MKFKEYALYKGDELLGIGTLNELSKRFGIKIKSLLFYQTPAYKRRTSEKRGKRLVQC